MKIKKCKPIKLPKPKNRDYLALHARNKNATVGGAMKNQEEKREKQKIQQLIDESLDELADMEFDFEDLRESEDM